MIRNSNSRLYILYRGADKTLARSGMNQTNVSVRMATMIDDADDDDNDVE